jgi:hypothetical protein
MVPQSDDMRFNSEKDRIELGFAYLTLKTDDFFFLGNTLECIFH